MSSSHAIPLVVGMAGLELLPRTRLKVACSLMAAERLALQPADWDGRPCALLVADESSPEGRLAVTQASVAGTPVLRIGEPPAATAPDFALGRQATVREFVDALRAALSARAGHAPASEGEPALPPFLEAIRLDQRGKPRRLLEQGLLRVVVDAGTSQLHLLRRVPLEAVLQAAARPDWSVAELDEAAWQDGFAADVISTHAIESLWWRIAPELPAELLGVEFQGMRMRAWPDLEPGGVALGWMLPLACLQLREWRPQELANATGLALKDVRRIMAAARFAGLGGHAGADRGTLLPGRGGAHQALSVLKLAKRFGMKLLGVVNG